MAIPKIMICLPNVSDCIGVHCLPGHFRACINDMSIIIVYILCSVKQIISLPEVLKQSELYRVSQKKGNPTLARYCACISSQMGIIFRYYETAEF